MKIKNAALVTVFLATSMSAMAQSVVTPGHPAPELIYRCRVNLGKTGEASKKDIVYLQVHTGYCGSHCHDMKALNISSDQYPNFRTEGRPNTPLENLLIQTASVDPEGFARDQNIIDRISTEIDIRDVANYSMNIIDLKDFDGVIQTVAAGEDETFPDGLEYKVSAQLLPSNTYDIDITRTLKIDNSKIEIKGTCQR